MLVREIKSENLAACGDLYSRVFSGPPWSENWSKEKALERLAHFYNSEGFVGLLSENNNVHAFVLGNTEPFVDGDWFYLREMCVDKELQGQGVGSMLLDELKKRLVSLSVKNIYLATERDFPAASFYEKNDFLPENKMAFYYKELRYENNEL